MEMPIRISSNSQSIDLISHVYSPFLNFYLHFERALDMASILVFIPKLATHNVPKSNIPWLGCFYHFFFFQKQIWKEPFVLCGGEMLLPIRKTTNKSKHKQLYGNKWIRNVKIRQFWMRAIANSRRLFTMKFNKQTYKQHASKLKALCWKGDFFLLRSAAVKSLHHFTERKIYQFFMVNGKSLACLASKILYSWGCPGPPSWTAVNYQRKHKSWTISLVCLFWLFMLWNCILWELRRHYCYCFMASWFINPNSIHLLQTRCKDFTAFNTHVLLPFFSFFI